MLSTQNNYIYTSETSEKIMYENAIETARIFELCRRPLEERGYALLMLDIIFIAASTLITSMVSPRCDRARALKDYKWLVCFLETSEGLQDQYPVVKRMVEALESLLVSSGLSKFIWRGIPIATGTTDAAVPSFNQASLFSVSYPAKAVPFRLSE